VSRRSPWWTGLLALVVLWSTAVARADEARPWALAASWTLDLEDPDLQALASSTADLLVVDYSRDGSDAGRLTRSEVQALQRRPDGGRRLVLAWVPVGQAARHRFYWQPEYEEGNPPWLASPVPGWEGLFQVRYWDPDWLAILCGSPDAWVDQVIESGFDGVVLDPAGAWTVFAEQGWTTARQDMVDLIDRVARYARAGAGGPDFGVFAWNDGDGLVNDPRFLKTVTGIVQEGTWFGGEVPGTATSPERTETLEASGRLLRMVGAMVLNLDDTDRPEQVRLAQDRARAAGFLECAAPSERAR